MARGPKKHMKRVAAPKAWLLDKMGGVYATRPAQGPHRLRECVPLSLILTRTLKYALNGREAIVILNDPDNEVQVDGVVRRYHKYPVGLMDVVTIPKTGDQFRVLYDVKGRFTFVPLRAKEIRYKLCKVTRKFIGPNKIPYIVTHDARTIRFANPAIGVGDTIKYDLRDNRIVETFRQDIGNLVLTIGGNNKGRVGVISNIVRKPGKVDVTTVRDSRGRSFTTRLVNVFVLGNGRTPSITLPRGLGLKRTIMDRVAANEEEED